MDTIHVTTFCNQITLCLVYFRIRFYLISEDDMRENTCVNIITTATHVNKTKLPAKQDCYTLLLNLSLRRVFLMLFNGIK